jgi:cyclic beta-1,2-glucan synthetase
MRVPRPLYFPSLLALEPPIRAELFGVERLERHGRSLAAAQPVASGVEPKRSLLPRVEDNGAALRKARRVLADVERDEHWTVPAAEWLLDNFFVVDDQLRGIRDDLPVGFYKELPALAGGPLVGFPRVYGIAWAYVAHTDSRFDPETLRRFVRAYQAVQPLTIGELWAVTISLRVVLVENLRRLADAMVGGHAARAEADQLADELLGMRGRDIQAAATMMSQSDDSRLVTAFAVELVLRLRDQDPAVTPALVWLQKRLTAQGTTADEIAMVEHRRQAAMTVTVRNIITSMRLMSALDWPAFFESVSLVDERLRAGSDFAAMDFISRDSYRHAIEALARGSGQTELDIAAAALSQARAARAAGTGDAARADPGFYLVGRGRREFEQTVGFRPRPWLKLRRRFLDLAPVGYLGTLLLLTLGMLAIPVVLASAAGMPIAGILVLAVLALIPASDLAVALLNRIVTSIVEPRLLPRLEWPGGVPAACRTMVAVPTLFTDVADAEAQVNRLEVHYLANSEGDVRFALVSDWRDASLENMPGDAAILAAARAGVARLNARHGPASDGGDRFFVLHRRRKWNANERVWMGWERKRGKLHELNRLLRGAGDTSFLGVNGQAPGAPGDVRYVLTLDADTRVPSGAIARLVGTMAHPLNQPRFDPVTRRVSEGYAVLQPRVATPLPGRAGSPFQRLCSGHSGIDPYASAVSDVYQDLFGEGSYTGKGIYDLDAFEAALAGRVPDNTLLSHDLFEGMFARAGLVTDVELFESAPRNYLTAAARQRRWGRGDWQLLPWIVHEALSPIDRWKMLDNLRRTLSMPAAWLTLVFGWAWPGSPPGLWATFVLTTVAIPPLLPSLAGMWPRVSGISMRSHFRAVARDVRDGFANAALTVATMAFQAWEMAGAVAQTLWRLRATHGRMLEWETMEQAGWGVPRTVGGFYRRMRGGLVLTVLAAGVVAWQHSGATWLAVAVLASWGLVPVVAWWVSRVGHSAHAAIVSADDALALRLVARRTWQYFTTFVTAESNALPPDNFQEAPHPVVAERTSPTNIGLYLLSVVSARDFGWVGTLDAVERIEQTLRTVGGLEHYRGHLYNWYDTRDGRALEPRYVSSVDSGNLAGALFALANACEEMVERPVPWSVVRSGICDAALLLRDLVPAGGDGGPVASAGRRRLDAALDVLLAAATQPWRTRGEWVAGLAELDAAAWAVDHCAQELGYDDTSPHAARVRAAGDAVRAAVATHTRDIDTLMPWAPLPGGAAAEAAGARVAGLAATARAMVAAMEFGFLFDPARMLFAIGYRTADGVLDAGRYDLLASEARVLSFIAIAKGDVPVRHWFRLGRPLTPVGSDGVLVSWSGSMFEYLMPRLIMRAPQGSLLEQTGCLAVQRQMEYGAEQGVPWGMSESGYFVRDLGMTYQYSNFGVPGLGLRRGLGDDVVVAPYATALAAMVDAKAAAQNFRVLAGLEASGHYGFYEALDYTPVRLPVGTQHEVVRMYMAHHQGMTIVSIGNVLHSGAMRARFHAEPMVRASELLLQERTPRDVAVARPRVIPVRAADRVRELVPPTTRHFSSPHGVTPRVQLLSNGRYAVMITGAGSGYSRWQDLAVTRWREDATRDDTGAYFLLRDVATGERWSAGYQPSGAAPARYEVTFTEDRAEFLRRDGTMSTRCEVIVSSEDDAEVRRISLTNHGTRTREIEVTSYAELVLGPSAADTAHPAFSSLFVETEVVPDLDTLLATRRRRAPGEAEIWLAHVVAVEGGAIGDLEWETDRGQFLGRGRTVRAPRAETDGRELSNTVGAVLDPIVSLRRRVRIRPGKTVRATFSTVVASSRNSVLDLADKYHDVTTFERASTLAWTQAQVQLHHLGIGADEAHLFQMVAGSIVFADRALRAPVSVAARRREGVAALWALGISGDLPIVLVEIDATDDIGIVRQLLRAHAYWRMKRLPVDLVILNDRAPSYVQDLQTLIETLVRKSTSMPRPEGSESQGAVFTCRADRLTGAQRDVLESVARVNVSSRRGTLAEQVARAFRPELALPAPPLPARTVPPAVAEEAPAGPAIRQPPVDLEFYNGVGGFDREGREYVTVVRPGQGTPAPWINVIANPDFGCLISEAGVGGAWSLNSQANLLTAWSNDPVSDPPSEAFYIRDEESGDLWSATPLPVRESADRYVVRHGYGYTRFEHDSHGVALDLLHFVPVDDSIKVARLTLTNHTALPKRLGVTAYLEWVLGVTRSASAPYVATEMDPTTGAMFARNTWSRDFGTRVAFADLAGMQTAWTADRTEFLGRNGAPDRPAALVRHEALSGRTGVGLDPCCALQRMVEIPAGGQVSVVFLLGQAETAEQARALITRYRADDLDVSLAAVTEGWDQVLGAVQVETPDRALDLMLNGWWLYQTLACRVWARAAFYQASGAYGFRDQLQDVMALAVSQPDLTRAQLLKAASRQFVQGDVQHWWHEPAGRGVRTRISDDLLWLPYVATHYLTVTGDDAVLDHEIPFLEGAELADGQAEAYFEPQVAGEHGSLFEHCARAIDRSLAVGAHGLPLIGTGDWNDGMNLVGVEGKGESVWLAWILHEVLSAWTPVAAARGELARAERWAGHGTRLKAALARDAWDGGWYRRAYFDDGTPLGTAGADACAVDSIAQSWSVLSGAGDPIRARRAMAALYEHLVLPQTPLVLLLTPPFDHTLLEPGYIKGYVPGVRENGAQYTHAAAWVVIAFAMLGEGDRAAEVLAMLNPITHTSTPRGIQVYRVEPYVAVGDLYSQPPHVGRGGWSWYTGSAAWLYRAGIEWVLGVRQERGRLVIDPCIPEAWPGFTVRFRHGAARYDITVENSAGVCRGVSTLELDGVPLEDHSGIPLIDDRTIHQVRAVMGGVEALTL